MIDDDSLRYAILAEHGPCEMSFTGSEFVKFDD
jgi:hypothetical protein